MPNIKWVETDNAGNFGPNINPEMTATYLRQVTPLFKGKPNQLPIKYVNIFKYDPITNQYVNLNFLNNLKTIPWIFEGATIKEENNNQ